jgi:hypothetical protein
VGERRCAISTDANNAQLWGFLAAPTLLSDPAGSGSEADTCWKAGHPRIERD